MGLVPRRWDRCAFRGIMCAWDHVCMEMYSMHPMILNSLENLLSPQFLFPSQESHVVCELDVLQSLKKGGYCKRS